MTTCDILARGYDRMLAPLERGFLSAWRKEAIRHLPENVRLLEIGAGTGLNFRHYPPDIRRAAAVDLSPEMLGLAREKTNLAAAADRLSLVQADAARLPFAENSFDAALATLVLCSVPDPEKAFAEINRVVKNHGPVILLEHVRPSGLLGYLFDVLNIFTVALIDDHFNRETARLVRRSGLKIKKIEKKARGAVNLIIAEVEKEIHPPAKQ